MSLQKLSLFVLVGMRVGLLHQLEPFAGSAALARAELEKGSLPSTFSVVVAWPMLGLTLAAYITLWFVDNIEIADRQCACFLIGFSQTSKTRLHKSKQASCTTLFAVSAPQWC
jgi:hypothetical protein